ncbi:MAG TPA: formate dehydrogenase accessory sulfurtransferase FdhD [Chloroflexota bacterium]
MLDAFEAPPRPTSTGRRQVWRVEGARAAMRSDSVATEEPLEVRLLAGAQRQTLAVTMRTPGADFELAAGFLYGEGVLADPGELRRISYCVDPEVDPEQRYNIVNVELRAAHLPELASLERHFFTSSACGVCGKAGLEALHVRGCSVASGPAWLTSGLVTSLPDKLRAAQSVFESTGGLHGAGLFTSAGELLALREDVGRHNAVDKLIGWAFLQGKLPLAEHIVLVSGRSSYEIMQKCLAAGVPVVCAVSAPSSLAVTLAEDFGMTLIGFLRGDRFNVYAGRERFVQK